MKSENEKSNQEAPVSPSLTALAVAQGYYLSSAYHGLPYDQSKRLTKYLVRYAKHQYPTRCKWPVQLFDSVAVPVGRFLQKGMFHSPGFSGFIATRKKYIENAVDDAIAKGAKQILVIAGGFDSMATIKHKQYPDVQFFEIDRGPHRDMKQKALAELGAETISYSDLKADATGLQEYGRLDSNIHFIDADMSQPDWKQKLENSGYNVDAKTLCIAEGFTMYLTRDEVSDWLHKMRVLLTAESSLITSFMADNSYAQLTKKMLDKTGENLKLLLSPVDVPKFMYEHGFTIGEYLSCSEIHHQLGTIPEQAVSSKQTESYYKVSVSQLNAKLQDINTVSVATVHGLHPEIEKESDEIIRIASKC